MFLRQGSNESCVKESSENEEFKFHVLEIVTARSVFDYFKAQKVCICFSVLCYFDRSHFMSCSKVRHLEYHLYFVVLLFSKL